MQNQFDPNNASTKYSSTDYINQKVLSEIAAFTADNKQLKKDIEYVFSIGVPHRGKTALMFACGEALSVNLNTLTPFAIVAELMMAVAMNDDDIIDGNDSRYGREPLYKIVGVNRAMMVTCYMYALIFSILEKHRPTISDDKFATYTKSEALLTEYFRLMHEAQYITTSKKFNYANFSLNDLRNLAYKKASVLFEFCTSVPAYFANVDTSYFKKFGSVYGIAVQYKSDIRDFKFDPNDTDKNKLRLEDYYTGQPNLVLLFATQSNILSQEDRDWLIKTWSNPVPVDDKTSKMVFNLVTQSMAIEHASARMQEIKTELESYICKLPTEELRTYLTALVTGVAGTESMRMG